MVAPGTLPRTVPCMTATVVYRVESMERVTGLGLGVGPFQASNYGWETAATCACVTEQECVHLNIDIYGHGNACWSWVFPDLFTNPNGSAEQENWVACTTSLEDLREWFTFEECESLDYNAFTVSVYRAVQVREADGQAIAYAPAGMELVEQFDCVDLYDDAED